MRADFEEAFAGVRKAANDAERDFDSMQQEIRDTAKTIPATTAEAARMARMKVCKTCGIAEEEFIAIREERDRLKKEIQELKEAQREMEMTREFYRASVRLRGEIRKRSNKTEAEAEWFYQFTLLPAVQRRIQGFLEAAITGEG